MKSTVLSPSNIAFVKYWGKKDLAENIPMNPSISMTLDHSVFTKTTVEFLAFYSDDIFILDGKPHKENKLFRVSNFLDIFRKAGKTKLKAKVVSENSFPTGSGMASSASGFAALACAASQALKLDLDKKNLSLLARQASGSAARSIFGGFVYWEDEYAHQLLAQDYWPDLCDVIVVLSEDEKQISSREAMILTAEKSNKFNDRQNQINKTLDQCKKALESKDFEDLGKIIMAESDNMHECINEIGIEYLTPQSYEIKNIINALNKDKIIAAYTFDAGPNAHIITHKKHVDQIKNSVSSIDYKRIIVSSVGGGIEYTNEHLF